MTTPSLHGKPRHPYYIAAPNYRETSSGVCVLHYLCHVLNLSGYEAYLTPCQVNPKLRTPILTDELRRHHRSLGLAPIAVYSEVVDGNPIGAPIVARYILNREGFLTGRAIKAQKTDLFFYYTQDFGGDSDNSNLLLLPVIDSELFSPPTESVQRSGNYLYLHRIDRSKVDYSMLPDDIEVLSMANPKTLTELAQIFRTASTLYSYEISATCTEAMLCGCPVVYMPGGHVKTQPFIEQFGDAGSALYDEPGGLERARATVLQARRRWLELEKAFWPQLERFIDITQQVAVQHAIDARVPSVKDWLRNRVLTPIQQQLVDGRRQQLSGQTSLTLLIRDPLGDFNALSDTLESLALWRSRSSISLRMVVLSTAPSPADLPASLHWLTCAQPGAVELNEILQADDSDWIMLLTAGDEVLPAGTLMLDLELPGANGCRMIYCDGMYRSENGPQAVLRPCINLDYLLSLPLTMANHWLVRRELALQVGGYDPQVPEALELDLILRLIEVGSMNGIAHLSEPLVVSNTPTLANNPDECLALQRHLSNRGYTSARIQQEPTRHYHIKYGHDQQPLVSILIPTRDQLPLLQRCVESLLSKTRYPHFEIILIDNCSETEEALTWLSEMESIGGDKVRVIRFPYPFNFSAMNNLAANQARGEYLVLLNNDTAIIREDWLDELLNHALRPEVGIVGAKLISPAGTVQHAGLITGLRGPAGSPFVDQAANGGGYMQRLLVDQNTSAVSAACLMIRTAIYLEAGGMDDAQFQVTCNDLDLCLKVANLGYLNVWTPHAVLLHEGEATWSSVGKDPLNQQRFAMEQEQALSKWLSVLANDPAYNSNLSLRGAGFELEAVNELTWRPLSWRPLPVVLVHPAKSAKAANLRIVEPFTALRDYGKIEGCISNSLLPATTLARYNPDVIVFQHQADPLRLEQMERINTLSKAFKVLELDALAPATPGWTTSLQQAASLVDRIIVATPAMAAACAGLHHDIRVLETRLDSRWRNLPNARQTFDIPRIGCDIDPMQPFVQPLIIELMQALAGQVEWVLWGDVPAYLRPLASEVHEDVHDNPDVMASLNLDIVLAPLGFGWAEGGLSLLDHLQYGACGYSVIGSDTADYLGDLAITRVANSREQWLEAIRDHLADRHASRQQAARLREQVLDNWVFDDAYATHWVKGWMPD
ncbi:glycosyltransferase family 2 protein [Pseudomonas sp. Tri1]|uniref:glycosyltransferase family 2 protein n=1 Tax=Pseudomonas sp. Tri1 TaxID=2823875 RepID=UPI001B319C57|nr:glycosyltransferase family 2 protein [Pseudomonas sp. Tri1]